MSIKINNSQISSNYVGDLDLGKIPKLFLSTTEGKIRINGTLFKKESQVRAVLPDSDIVWKPGDSLNDYFRGRIEYRKELVNKLNSLRTLKTGLENGEVTYGLNKNLINNLVSASDSQRYAVPLMVMGGHVTFDDIRKSQDAISLESDWNHLVNTTRTDYSQLKTDYDSELISTEVGFTETRLESEKGYTESGDLVIGFTASELGLRKYSVNDSGKLVHLENLFELKPISDYEVVPSTFGLVFTAIGTNEVYGGVLTGNSGITFTRELTGVTSVSCYPFEEDGTNYLAYVATKLIVGDSDNSTVLDMWLVDASTGTVIELITSNFETTRTNPSQLYIREGKLVLVSDDYVDIYTLSTSSSEINLIPVEHPGLPVEIQLQSVDALSVVDSILTLVLSSGGSDFFAKGVHLNPSLWSEDSAVFDIFPDDATSVRYFGTDQGTLLFGTDEGLVEIANNTTPYLCGIFNLVQPGYALYKTSDGSRWLYEMTGTELNLYKIYTDITRVETWQFDDVRVDINAGLIGGQHPLIGVTPPDTINPDKLFTSPTEISFLEIIPVGNKIIGRGEAALEVRNIERGETEREFLFDLNADEVDPILSSIDGDTVNNGTLWTTTPVFTVTDSWSGEPGGVCQPGGVQTTEIVNIPAFDNEALKVTKITTATASFPPTGWASMEMDRYYTINFKYSCSNVLNVEIGGEAILLSPDSTSKELWVIPLDHTQGVFDVNVCNLYSDDNEHPEIRYWTNTLHADIIYPISSYAPGYSVEAQNLGYSTTDCHGKDDGVSWYAQSSSIPALEPVLEEKDIPFKSIAAKEGTSFIVLRDLIPDEDETPSTAEPRDWDGATLSLRGSSLRLKLDDIPFKLLGLTLINCASTVGTLADLQFIKNIRIY